ncbi:beta-induced protein ig-h3 [Seminavis robusta]|uniref:Beta-induced protein ig-h3 n=1 Tax=Seminavis robusta TaxID=568900 RepID=A0A9N8ECJ2_9STRA|nr:beta-induced protein ig-h3 [Seminavis robusta]|eukprot:Sro801_g204470.1 beta-induced protein ig-h3 (1069) ;mRNA; r:18597-21803
MMTIRRQLFPILLSLWVLLLPLHLCNAQGTILEVMDTVEELTTFSLAIDVAGLTDLLSDTGPYTVLAPNNTAMESQLSPKYLMPEWSAHLTEILLQHVVEGPPFLTLFWREGLTLTPVSGSSLTITSTNPTFQIINNGGEANATVITPNLQADNGVIHIVDRVIIPPSARDSIMDIISFIPEFFSTLNNLLVLTGLDAVLDSEGPYTMFAPSNDAFDKLSPDLLANLQEDPAQLRQVLEYHIVPGIYLVDTLNQPNVTTLPTLNGAPLPKPVESIQFVDLLATNGVMHIVQDVQLPPVESGITTGAPAIIGTAVPETPAPSTSVPETPAPTATLQTPEPTNVPETPVPTPQTPEPTSVPATPVPTVVVTNPLPEPETAAPETPAPSTNNVRETPAPAPTSGGGTIVDIAIEANFTTMVFALNQTEWYATLDNPDEGPYTVFLVPDDGFDTMPDKYLQDPVTWNSHLTNVLTYHILNGQVLESALTVNATFFTLNANNNITVTSQEPFLQVNNVNITETDIVATNGIAHVAQEIWLPPSAVDTALDVITQFPDEFSTFLSLLEQANLTSLFAGPGPLTAFVPVNDAWDNLPENVTLESLTDNPGLLERLILYHGTPQLAEIGSLNILDSYEIPTFLEGANVTLSRVPMIGLPLSSRVNGAAVPFFDLLVQNGLVQVIDAVLIPPPPPETEEPTMMDSTMIPTELATTESPTAAATAQATEVPTVMETIPITGSPTGMPSLVVEATSSPTITVTEVSTTDSPTAAVTSSPTAEETIAMTTLMPSTGGDSSPGEGAMTLPPTVGTTDAELSILDVIEGDEDFSILNDLIIQTDLDTVFETEGPMTVFAPNNEAFALLPDDVLQTIQTDVDALRDVLLYHVVDMDEVLSSELTEGAVYPTAQGNTVMISTDGSIIMVNDATVLIPDIVVSNGVIHVIDMVLIPPSTETPTISPVATEAPTISPVATATDEPSVSPIATTTDAPSAPPAPTNVPSTATSSPSERPVAGTPPPTTTDVVVTTPPVAGTPPPVAPPFGVPATLSPSSAECVAIPGQVVCCPPGQTEGIYFFCRYI